MSIEISDIKYVHYLIGFSGDFGQPDIQVALKKRIGDAVQQAGKVIGDHIDDGKKTRAVVVHRHPVRLLGQATFRLPAGGKFSGQSNSRIQFAAECSMQLLLCMFPLFIFQHQVRRRFHLENIHSHLVAPGKYLDIQNVDVIEGKHTGNF